MSDEWPKHLQDATRTRRSTFRVADPNDQSKTVPVVYASFAACMEREANSKQAEIDRLMLEYCPDEMTEVQKERWAAHQIAECTECSLIGKSACAEHGSQA